jgi:hypothetical protein
LKWALVLGVIACSAPAARAPIANHPEAAAGETGSIAGLALKTTPGHLAGAGAIVVVTSKQGRVVARARSDEVGRFSIAGLPAGPYTVTVRWRQQELTHDVIVKARKKPSIIVSIFMNEHEF